jgi:hypothetical protein
VLLLLRLASARFLDLRRADANAGASELLLTVNKRPAVHLAGLKVKRAKK